MSEGLDLVDTKVVNIGDRLTTLDEQEKPHPAQEN
jgi:hypothetical protein